MTEIDPKTSCTEMPITAAPAFTRPTELARSCTVVLPFFMAMKNASETCAASLAWRW